MGLTMGLSSEFAFQISFEAMVLLTRSCQVSTGILSSMTLETLLLHVGREKLPWRLALGTAARMSLASMLAMEAAENLVDIWLTGGVVGLGSVRFWAAAGASIVAGFLVPLPYNYYRLRKLGKACH